MFTQRIRNYLSWLLIIIILAFVLGCGSNAAQRSRSSEKDKDTPTPEPQAEVVTPKGDPNFALTLPYEIKDSEGWTFTIKRVELLDSIETSRERLKPENDAFLWLVGTVSNFTDQDGCTYGRDYVIYSGSEKYEMSRELVDALHDVSKMDYPGFLLGQCLDYDETVESFLLFDLPLDATNLWLELNDSKVQLGHMATLLEATPVPAIPQTEESVAAEAETSSEDTATQQEVAETEAPTEADPETTSPMVTAANSNINIRSGPGTDFQAVGSLKAGESLEIVGRNTDSSWWQVNTPNGLGWVAASVTTASNMNDGIPVAEVALSPTQAAPVEAAAAPASEPVSEPISEPTATPVPATASGCPNPGVQITSPAPGSRFDSTIVVISGSANVPNFHHYRIEYATDPNAQNWTFLFEKDMPVENGSLMELNTTTVPYGPYGVRLTVVDQSGNYPEPCVVWFNDLSAPEPAPAISAPTVAPAPTVAAAPSNGHPAGASALCRDGTYSYSANRRGTCSHHGGVAQWLP